MKNKRALWIAGAIVVIYLISLFLPSGSNIEPEEVSQLEDTELAVEQPLDLGLLQGKWQSLDDHRSIVDFIENKKIDYYSGTKIVEETFKVEDDHLTVGDGLNIFEYQIVELSDDKLTLINLPRGNILEYFRI